MFNQDSGRQGNFKLEIFVKRTLRGYLLAGKTLIDLGISGYLRLEHVVSVEQHSIQTQ